ncbi:MAG: hypothetical protein FJX52_14585 [Alphaproteobacteria bacterium]|nr:hypothetical protein [Alphaproteobacteria bacterium]
MKITDLRIGGHTIPVGRFNDARPGVALDVPASANSFSVEFASLDYSAPARINYRYRLDGFDPDWMTTDASRAILIVGPAIIDCMLSAPTAMAFGPAILWNS